MSTSASWYKDLTNPALDRAKAVLEDQPAERRKLLMSLFERVWVKEGRIVAVQPHDAFLPYFQAAQKAVRTSGAESGSDGGRVRCLHIGGLRFGSRARAA
jgi:hypothetical protein